MFGTGDGSAACIVARSAAAFFGLTIFCAGAPARGATEKVLWSFSGTPDGAFPAAGLTRDAAGNLYGTTQRGGVSGQLCQSIGCGAVFEVSPTQGGAWTETVLHSFSDQWQGAYPNCMLIFDRAGNLYGTTPTGYIEGDVFELAHLGSSWRYLILHEFQGPDGTAPWSGLVSGPRGNLYGVTAGGGAALQGVVFEVAPTPGVGFASVIHSFNGGDGDGPITPMIFDKAGNLYGSTNYGGGSPACGVGCGVVFELTRQKQTWTETPLHIFSGGDGMAPGMLVADGHGNLFGTTTLGGKTQGCLPGCGTVFELSQTAPGKWKHTIIHAFSGADGASPGGNLVFDAAGNLYGAAANGAHRNGCQQQGGCGAVFELSPGAGEKWAYRLVHEFGSGGADGRFPTGVIRDAAGNLYGTTLSGGTSNLGTVFEISP